MKFSYLSNHDLVEKTKQLVSEERRLTTEILVHLKEIEARRIHLERGFSSLHQWCVKVLGYTDAEAYHRIQAMRLIKDIPEVQDKIEAGRLSLSNASQIQKFFVSERKDNRRVYSNEEKRALVKSLENTSTREAERVLTALFPVEKPKESIRPLAEDSFELRVVLDGDLVKKLDEIKKITGSRNYAD